MAGRSSKTTFYVQVTNRRPRQFLALSAHHLTLFSVPNTHRTRQSPSLATNMMSAYFALMDQQTEAWKQGFWLHPRDCLVLLFTTYDLLSSYLYIYSVAKSAQSFSLHLSYLQIIPNILLPPFADFGFMTRPLSFWPVKQALDVVRSYTAYRSIKSDSRVLKVGKKRASWMQIWLIYNHLDKGKPKRTFEVFQLLECSCTQYDVCFSLIYSFALVLNQKRKISESRTDKNVIETEWEQRYACNEKDNNIMVETLM